MKYANGIEMIHEDFGRGWAVRFIGTEGSIDVSRSFFESTPQNLIAAELKAGETKLYNSENHLQDWLDAIKKKNTTDL